MRILMASSFFPSHPGGLETVAGALFAGFAGRDLEVFWMAADVTPPPEPVGRSRAVSFHVFNFVEDKIGVPFPIPKLSAMREITRQVGRADILILHDCLYLSNILAYLCARWHGIPTLVIQHTAAIAYRNPILKASMKLGNRILVRRMLANAAQVVFVSEISKRYFARVPFKNLPEVIYSGVDTGLFRMRAVGGERAEIRRKFGLPEAGRHILFAGRFVERKGLAAIRKMAEQRPEWTWVFAGWGPLNPSSWNADNVRVLSGLSDPAMATLYRACDLLVLPSVGEGFGLVMLQALATGLPAVCGEETLAADAAIGEFVRGAPVFTENDERTARVFVEAMDELFASDPLSIEISERRRAFAVSRYSWDRATDRYVKIISRLAVENGTPTGQIEPAVGAGQR